MKYVKLSLSIVIFLSLFNSFSFAEEDTPIFYDIEGHWAHEVILWGTEQGIINGYPNGTYQPQNDVTEAEILKMLISAYDPSELRLQEDGDIWHDRFYEFSQERFWILPSEYIVEDLKNEPINRGDIAVILANTLGQDISDVNEAIQYILDVGISEGKTDATIEGYGKDDYLTRAEAIQFIHNFKVKKNVTELKYRPNKELENEIDPKEELETALIEAVVGEKYSIHTFSYAELDDENVDPDFYGVYRGGGKDFNNLLIKFSFPNDRYFTLITTEGDTDNEVIEAIITILTGFGIELPESFGDELEEEFDEYRTIVDGNWKVVYQNERNFPWIWVYKLDQ